MTTKERVEEFRSGLFEYVDEYFPKIEPFKGNKGRGEAIVIVGMAVVEFTKALKETEEGVIERKQEVLDRMNHYYLQMDGSMDFPNSREGDLLKMVYDELLKSINK